MSYRNTKSTTMRIARGSLLGSLAVILITGSCQGEISTPGSSNPNGPGAPGDPVDPPSAEALDEIGESGIRRMSAAEYDATVQDLLGVTVNSALVLPEDIRRPFDNDYTTQQASDALITSVDSLAGQIATEVSENRTLREAIMPCEPSGPSDADCYRQFVEDFGRRALRRPLAPEEVERYTAFMTHAAEEDNFWVAVDSALRAFLQHPEFINRIEIGNPVTDNPGVYRLTSYELATRLSYFLLGSTTPAWLLDAAAGGDLDTAEGIRTTAEKLLQEPAAKEHMGRFHAMWLGYERIPLAADLVADLNKETQALLDRVVFEQDAPWADLLRSTETYLTKALAQHYDLPEPSGNSGWVSYGDSGRRGLLSQGAILSAVSKFGDTSPTQRGQLINRALFCREFPLPDPSLDVNVDEPPGDPDDCKIERYDMWKRDGCKGCHLHLDPIGFGLENYDAAGRYREFETGRPECSIDGHGVIEGVGEFTGPAQLADLVVENPSLNDCVGSQVYRYSMGRLDLKKQDHNFVDRLVEASSVNGEVRLKSFVLELVSSDAFRHRREEAAQ